jgi:hypothetical protein
LKNSKLEFLTDRIIIMMSWEDSMMKKLTEWIKKLEDLRHEIMMRKS